MRLDEVALGAGKALVRESSQRLRLTPNRVPLSPKTTIGLQRISIDTEKTELYGQASDDINIISFAFRGNLNHCMWLDRKIVSDGHLPSSSICIVPAGVEPRAVLGVGVDLLHIYVTQSTLVRLALDAGQQGEKVTLVNLAHVEDSTVAAIAPAISASMLGDGPLDTLLIDQMCLALAAHLLKHYSNLSSLPKREPVHGGLASWQVARVTEYLAADLTRDVTLGELAGLVGLSDSHFCRAFKTSTGLSPFQWRLKRRLECAKVMLARSPLELAQLAIACGFADQNHFSTAFRRSTGTSPGNWRRQHKV